MQAESLNPSASENLEIIRRVSSSFDHDRHVVELFYPPDYFVLGSVESDWVERDAQRMFLNQDAESAVGVMPVDRHVAQQQYRELGRWNRETHNKITEFLTPLFLRAATRAIDYALEHQVELERWSADVSPVQLSYAVASLPPNLFDHCPQGPFIPQTDEEIARLVSEFGAYNRRFIESTRSYRPNGWPHAHMGDDIAMLRDVARDLRRRRDQDDQTFYTSQGRREWAHYNKLFKQEMVSRRTMSLHQNAIFISYSKNREFTEAGGFFEKTDAKFDSFWLIDIDESPSLFTAQHRVPIGAYGAHEARDLAVATRMLMRLVAHDQEFVQEIKQLLSDPEKKTLLKQHLMRSNDELTGGYAVEHGIQQSLHEGIISISSIFSALEADPIPGFDEEMWGGLKKILEEDVPMKLTTIAPQAVVVPTTLHGDYFMKILEPTQKGGLRLRPAVTQAWQEIHDIRTAAAHQKWQVYFDARDAGIEMTPPIRTGLHCPFKSLVVKAFSEALMVCRAIANMS